MESNPALTQMVKQAIYDLKKRYGNPATVYRLTDAETNYRTGSKSDTVSYFKVRSCVALPADEARRFFQGISFISSAKQFVSPGGQGFDQGTRAFIFDSRDLRGFEFEPEDWIIYRGARYDAKAIERLEYDAGWLVIGQELKGQRPEQVIEINVSNTLNFAQEG